jgi:hypothetical protein
VPQVDLNQDGSLALDELIARLLHRNALRRVIALKYGIGVKI